MNTCSFLHFHFIWLYYGSCFGLVYWSSSKSEQQGPEGGQRRWLCARHKGWGSPAACCCTAARGVSWWAHPPVTHKKVTFCFFSSFYHCFSTMQTPDSRCCSACSWCSHSCGTLAAPQAPWLWHVNLIFLSCFMLMLPRLEPGFCFSRHYMGNTKTVFASDSSNSKKAENKCLCLRFRALSHVLFGLFESRPTEMISLRAFLLPFSLELVFFFYILVLFCFVISVGLRVGPLWG